MKPQNVALVIASALLLAVLAGSASALSCAPQVKVGTVSFNDSTPILVDVRGLPTDASHDEIVAAYLEDSSALPEPIAWNPSAVVLADVTRERYPPVAGDVVLVAGHGPMCEPGFVGLYDSAGELRAAELIGGFGERDVAGVTIDFTPLSREDCGNVYCSTPVIAAVDGDEQTLSVNDSGSFDGLWVGVLRSDIVPEEAGPYGSWEPGMEQITPRGSGWESDWLHVLVAPEQPCIQMVVVAVNDMTGERQEFPTPCDVPLGWTQLTRGPIPVEPDGGIGDGAEGPGLCAQVITFAVNPQTQAVEQFPTPCDVPEGWEVVDEPIPVEPDGGIGDGADCIQVIAYAKNPETGEVEEFPTPCDVPEGWEEVPAPEEPPKASLWQRFTSWLSGLF